MLFRSVIAASGISRYAWLNNWKNGIYRSDNGNKLGKPNGDSPRPYPVLKFSELYFIAAEAAVKGATTTGNWTARNLINEIRGRAGVWTYDNNRQREKVADYSQQMKDATPQNITIEYILAERSREFFGEGYRWWDLVRDRKSTRLNSSHVSISYAVFCLKKKNIRKLIRQNVSSCNTK